MIHAVFYRQGSYVVGKIQGHAGYAENGKDIVCAAASILAFSLAEGLERAQKQGGLQSLMMCHSSGTMCFSFLPTPERQESVVALTEGMVIGFELLSRKFPKFVHVEIEEGLFPQKI